ncbi:MAG: hypothetical protein KF754_04545 [Planctomycetes bacterium]|nr:hypothetical protein [Planctomycetota bacterium]
MKNSIMLALLCAIAIFAVACGSGNNAAKGNGAVGNETGKDTSETADAWATYRKDGRSWTYKMTGDMKMTTTVKNVTDKGCDTVTQMYGADGKEMGAATTTPIKFETAAAPADGKAVETPKSKEEKVKSAAGEFDCISYDDGKTWMMKKYPAIIVKSDSMELVEFKE